MNLYRPRMATKSDLCTFHSQEYIDFLSRVTTENMSSYTRELEKFSVGLANGDTPLFGGKVFLHPYSHFTYLLSKLNGGASFRWSFGPYSAWGSKALTTIPTPHSSLLYSSIIRTSLYDIDYTI